MRKFSTLCFVMALFCVKGLGQQFNENFETFPLTQFSVSGSGYTATQNSTYNEQGASSVLFTTSSTSAQGALTMNNGINLLSLTNPKFSFYHICATETGADYGYVQYSTNGGTTWTSFPTSAYLGQGSLKNGVVSFDASSYTDWSAQFTVASSTPGTNSGGAFWKQEIIDLSAFKTSTNFKVRFAYTTNTSINYYGWLIDRLAIVSATALSGSAYIINNSLATGGNNYNNFSDAITDLNIKGVSSSVTFNVISGQTFTEDAPAIFALGTTTNTIGFIKSGSGSNPAIKPTGGSSTIDAGINISGGDYITFDGIDITEASGRAVEYGYYIASASTTNGAQNNTIKNTSITLNRANTNNSFGIYQVALFNPSNGSANTNNNNKYYNLTIKNAFGGVNLHGWTSANPDLNCEVGNTISSTSFNTIGDPATVNDLGGSGTGAYAVGIRATYQSSIKIYNNEVSNVYTTGSNSKAIGIYLETSIGSSSVYNNKVHDITTTSTATSLSATVTGIRADVSSGNTATIYNNFVYSLTHSIGSTPTLITTPVMNGIAINVGNTIGTANVYQNSVSLAANNTNAICAAFYVTTNSGTTVVKNNIFSNTSTTTSTTSKRYAFYYNSGTYTSDYNDLYVASGTNNFIGYYNADQASLANWKQATGKDASSRNENPPFTSPTDLHIPNGTYTELESSGAPVSVTNITTDIDGQTRPGPTGSINGGATAPDIGADEFDGKPVPIMTYSSSTAIQTSANACQGAQNVQIIGIQVVTANSALPLTLTNLIINPNGTTSLANSVGSYQVYYTGTNSTFSTTTPVNGATALTTGNNTVTPGTTLTLSTGTNYFWLVYNLKSTATGSLDAQFNSVTVTSGSTATTYTPTTTDPTGSVSVYIPPVIINPATSTVCSGTPDTLTASGADTYVWSPGAGLSATTGSIVTATVTANTTYTVTGTSTSTGCINTATSVITVNPLPAPVTVTPSPKGAVCSGTTVSLSSAASASISTTVSSGTISVTIPDNKAEGDSSLLTVSGIPANATVTGMSVTFNINHTYDGHLNIGLHAPNDVVLNLVNRDGGSGQNFINTTINSTSSDTIKLNGNTPPFTGTYAPDAGTGGATLISGYQTSAKATNFAELYSIPNGTWSLFARDMNVTGNADVGTITGWSITITYSVPSVWAPAANLYTDAATSIAYTPTTPISIVYFKQTNTTAAAINNNYTATITNGYGCSSIGNDTIAVNPATIITAQPNTTDQNLCINSNNYTLSVGATGLNLAYQWYYNAVNSNSGGTIIISATASVYTIPTTASGSYYYYVVVSGGCGTITSTVSGKISVSSTQITGQPVGATYCQNSTATALSVTVSGSGIAYQWYSNTTNNNTGGTAITNATGKTYIPSTTTAGTLYYYVVAGGDCGSATSATAQVIVNPPTSITSNVNTSGQTICQTTPATAISVTAVGGSLSYQWYSNTTNSNSSGTLISGATASSYTPPTATAGTTYYYVVVSGSCTPTSVTSSVAPVVVTPSTAITGNPSTSGQTLCQNSTATALSIGAVGTNLSYQWYSNTTNSNSGGTLISGATASSYTPSTATAGTTYYYVVVSGSCSPASVTSTVSGAVTVNVTPTATLTASSSTLCAGTGAQVTIVGTGGSSVTYTTNGGSPQTVTLTGGSYQFNTPTNSGTYTYTITNVHNSSCTGTTGAANQTATVTINPLPIVSAITPGGKGYVQVGLTLQLSDTPPSNATGAWTTSSSALATVDNTGLVSGVAAGTPTITYTVTDGTSAHCQNSATQALRVYTPDYVNVTASHNFSDNSNWQINRGDGTFVAAPSAPSGTNQGYNTITVTTPLNMDVDFQLPSGKSFTIATGGTMAILPNITFSSLGAVNFGGQSVTVKSVAPTNTSGTDVTFGTGAIGTMASTILNATNVTAERYIGSTAFSTGRRAWRLITAPVTGTTVNGAWQEGLVSNTTTPTVGNSTYGTLITGNQQGTASNAFSNGYDFWPQVANTYSSLRYYIAGSTSSLGSSWASYPSIKTLQINAQPAYMLFVRGNRSVESAGYPAGITTLRATGTLNQGTATTPVSGTSTYTLVGNPYASAIDFSKVWNANSSVIQNRFVEWNSQNGVNGAFALVQGNGAGSYTVVPSPFTGNPAASSNAQYIVSGQGFFVQPASSANGSLVITDNTKVSASTAVVNPYRISPSTEQKLYVNLNLAGSDSTTTLADGIMERFDPTYSAAIDGDDAPKQINFNENLGIESHSTDLIVEARPSVQKTDTVQLKLWNVSARPYQLQVKADQFALAAAQGLHAYLEDSYLKTREELSLTGSVSTIPFTVTGDAASYDLHRFRIVFQSEATVLPLTLTSVKAALQNSGVAISWTVQNEENIRQYVVERSTDGGATFTVIAEQKAKNLTGVALSDYAGFDAQPHRGSNLYRIRVEAADGRVTYSNTAKAVWGEDGSGKTLITLYPNPVSRREGRTTLTLSHLKEGAYLAGVYSEGGQSVMQKKITVAAGTEEQTEELPLGAALAQGSYEVRLTDSKGVLLFKSHLIISK